MNVSLIPELEKLVNEKVQSGEYGSRDEVFHAALRLLKERDQAEDHHDFTKRAPVLLAEAERKRKEFTVLAEEWARATRHLSLVQKKIVHPAYFRIVGMGEAAVPLLLEALRDRPIGSQPFEPSPIVTFLRLKPIHPQPGRLGWSGDSPRA